jgi:hypothetical protein
LHAPGAWCCNPKCIADARMPPTPGMRRASCMPLDGSCQRLRVAQCQRLIDSGPCTARPAPMMHIGPLGAASLSARARLKEVTPALPRRGLGPDPDNCRALCLRHPPPQQQSTCPTTSTTAALRCRGTGTAGSTGAGKKSRLRRPEAAAHASHPHCRRPMHARRPCCLFAPAPAVERGAPRRCRRSQVSR